MTKFGDNDSWTGPDFPATIGDPPKCLECRRYYNKSVILPSCDCRPTDAQTIVKLEARIEELEADKARLDWLEKSRYSVTPGSSIFEVWTGKRSWIERTLREAIDTAREQSP